MSIDVTWPSLTKTVEALGLNNYNASPSSLSHVEAVYNYLTTTRLEENDESRDT